MKIMNTFDEIGLQWIDILYIGIIGIVIYGITYFIYPPLIKWTKSKGWVGYDIHKTDRPETAESGGIGLSIGIFIGILIMGLIYNDLQKEMVVFLITIVCSSVIGFIDDRIELSSITKIIFMVGSGAPIFLFNYIGYISIDSPTLPLIGKLQLSVIYPLVIPFIVAIMTNTVNMLEGYNGEGSGTTSIAAFFIIICAIIARSSEGIIFGVPVFCAIFAFYKYNKYPAKVFPGDIGTLTIGASLALIGITGGLEVVMAIAVLTQIFNSFYVLASIRGWIKMKSIKDDVDKPDIYIKNVDGEDFIFASDEDGAPLTLPRLILAEGELKENQLVGQFLILATISGIFAMISELLRQNTPNVGHGISPITTWVIGILCVISFIFILYKNRRIIGIVVIMILLLLIGLILFYLIDQFIVNDPLNWLYSAALAGGTLIIWYYITIRHFWMTIDKMKKKQKNEKEE